MSATLPSSNDPPAAPPGAPRRLLIDDAPSLRQLSSLLARQYRLQHAHDGGVGLARAQALRPDLSERRLSTLFRKHLGLTVSGFVSEERIRVGCQMLGATQMSVQDIALVVGFANTANFSTAFRERLGLTPQAWRHQRRDDQREGDTT